MTKETSEMGFDPTDPLDQFKRDKEREEEIELRGQIPPKFIRDFIEEL